MRGNDILGQLKWPTGKCLTTRSLGVKPWFVTLAYFCGINILTRANCRLPTSCHSTQSWKKTHISIIQYLCYIDTIYINDLKTIGNSEIQKSGRVMVWILSLLIIWFISSIYHLIFSNGCVKQLTHNRLLKMSQLSLGSQGRLAPVPQYWLWEWTVESKSCGFESSFCLLLAMWGQ